MFLVSLGFFSTGAGAQQGTVEPKGPGKTMLILFLALGTDLSQRTLNPSAVESSSLGAA